MAIPVRFVPPISVRSSVSRPGFSLHFLLLNPISNLHFIFNPKYSLLFLNLSLWSGA